jgi:tetratricopeptide (TPR) repeat protein
VAPCIQHERGESKAYAFELDLLREYFNQGLLPPDCASDIKKIETRLLEAQRAEAAARILNRDMRPVKEFEDPKPRPFRHIDRSTNDMTTSGFAVGGIVSISCGLNRFFAIRKMPVAVAFLSCWLSLLKGQNSALPGIEQIRNAEALISRGDTPTARRLLQEPCQQVGVVGLWAARCLHDSGTIAQLEGQFEKAATDYAHAMDLWAVGGSDNPGMASTLHNLSEVLRELGRYPEAEDASRRSLAINQALGGQSSPRSILAAGQLGRVLLDEGKSAEASEWIELAIKLNALAPPPESAGFLRTAASLRTDQGRLTEALALMQRALEELGRTTSGSGSEYASALRETAIVLRRLGRPQEARPMLVRAAVISERAGGSETTMLAWIRREQALVELSEHHTALAEQLIRKSLSIWVSASGNRNPTDGLVFQSDLGAVLTEQKRYAEAYALLLEVEDKAQSHHLSAAATANNQLRLARLFEMQKNYLRAAQYCRAGIGAYEKGIATDLELATMLNDCAGVVRRFDSAEGRVMQQRAESLLKSKLVRH